MNDDKLRSITDKARAYTFAPEGAKERILKDRILKEIESGGTSPVIEDKRNIYTDEKAEKQAAVYKKNRVLPIMAIAAALAVVTALGIFTAGYLGSKRSPDKQAMSSPGSVNDRAKESIFTAESEIERITPLYTGYFAQTENGAMVLNNEYAVISGTNKQIDGEFLRCDSGRIFTCEKDDSKARIHTYDYSLNELDSYYFDAKKEAGDDARLYDVSIIPGGEGAIDQSVMEISEQTDGLDTAKMTGTSPLLIAAVKKSTGGGDVLEVYTKKLTGEAEKVYSASGKELDIEKIDFTYSEPSPEEMFPVIELIYAEKRRSGGVFGTHIEHRLAAVPLGKEKPDPKEIVLFGEDVTSSTGNLADSFNDRFLFNGDLLLNKETGLIMTMSYKNYEYIYNDEGEPTSLTQTDELEIAAETSEDFCISERESGVVSRFSLLYTEFEGTTNVTMTITTDGNNSSTTKQTHSTRYIIARTDYSADKDKCKTIIYKDNTYNINTDFFDIIYGKCESLENGGAVFDKNNDTLHTKNGIYQLEFHQ